MERYPAVRFMVRHGRWLAPVVGLAVAIAGLLATTLGAWGWGWGAASVAGGALLGLALRTLVELTEIIAEMLLPE